MNTTKSRKNWILSSIIVVLSIIGSFLLLNGCTQKGNGVTASEEASNTKSQKLIIGFSSYTQRGPYFSAALKTIEQKANENSWKLIATDAENKAEKQISDVEDMLARGINYLILNPKDADSGIRIVRSAEKKGVPVVTIDSNISAEAPVITRVLSPNFDSNFEIGKYVASTVDKSPLSIGMVDGEKGNLVTTARRNGFIQGLINWQLDNVGGTSFKINALLYTAWDAEGGVRGAEDLVSAFPDLNVIYVTTDDMARGAIKYLKSIDKLNDIAVVGFDGSNAGIELVEKGDYFATALNSPRLMVEKVFQVIKDYEGGRRSFPTEMSYDPVVITKESASQYKGKGF